MATEETKHSNTLEDKQGKSGKVVLPQNLMWLAAPRRRKPPKILGIFCTIYTFVYPILWLWNDDTTRPNAYYAALFFGGMFWLFTIFICAGFLFNPETDDED